MGFGDFARALKEKDKPGTEQGYIEKKRRQKRKAQELLAEKAKKQRGK